MILEALGEPPLVLRDARRLVWRAAACPAETRSATRKVPEETAVAFVYEGAAYAVMMATPADLEDFAVGFSLSEGIVPNSGAIESLDVVTTEDGVVLHMTLAGPSAEAMWQRRRRLAGPSGCGLCGIESLAEAARRPRRVRGDLCISASAITEAMTKLPALQPMNRQTGALHAAAFWTPEAGIALVREDVGRHNALDKLAGAAARVGLDGAEGAVLLTSRVSVEMVQKAAIFGASLLVAVSAPTALAVRAAESAGITLVAVARRDGFETFTHAERILADAPLPQTDG
ncbi:MAG TPA: formate dehydrogenase accessory sulfurtransferase FdhD [Stellaceae bacterium]|nr:formate dehydrogenase accessory sulfurtransferase FdhD [Stellaceae bacterium]